MLYNILMKKGKRIGKNRRVAIVVLAICLAVTLLCAAAPVGTQYTYKAVMNFSLYETTDLTSAVLVSVPQNAIVELSGNPVVVDGKEWQKIVYSGLTGYTYLDNLYLSSKNDNFAFVVGKAKSVYMGQSIPLYSVHDEQAEPVRYMNDGENLRVVVDNVSYGAFAKIEYDGEYYFIRSENVTNGLSFNQTLALIILGVVFVLTVVVVSVVVVLKRRKKRI